MAKDTKKKYNENTEETNPDAVAPNVFVEPPKLSEEEIKERSFDLHRLYQISQVRESALPQFDGMGYTMYNQTNEMADLSFLPPRKNKGDTQITSGITHEKDRSLASFFMNFNFEGKVRIFKKDQELVDVGTAITRLVRKSREIEDYDAKRPRNYIEFVSQGTAFWLERYVESWVPDKIITNDFDNLDEAKWIDKGLKLMFAGCTGQLVDGKKVFLENIREQDIQKQPGVYIVEYVSRDLLKTIWGTSKRWKNVPFMITPTANNLGTLATGSIYSEWIYGEIDFTKCEVIQVYRPFEQRYQIYINGVPMLKAKFPLKAVSPSGLIPIAKGDADPMSNFAYSKSEPSKTKIDQAVLDEVIRVMLMKFRQSGMVPRANNTDRVLTPDMFIGGSITANIDPKKIPPLIENPGITNADFSFYKFIRDQIDAKTISSIAEGNPTGETTTLGQYMDMQKKQMMKLGGKIDGIINWEKQMLKLRTLNLLKHGYREKEVSMEDTLNDGNNGLAVLKFEAGHTKTPEDIFNEQNQYEAQHGTKINYMYVDPDLMQEILDNPDYCIYYEVVPVDKNNDKLTQMIFVGMITQAANLFGMQSLQVEQLKIRYAQVFGEEFDNLFKSSEEIKLEQQQLMASQMATQVNGNQQGKTTVTEQLPGMKETAMFQ